MNAAFRGSAIDTLGLNRPTNSSFHVRQNHGSPADATGTFMRTWHSSVVDGNPARGHGVEDIMVIVECEANLFEIVSTLCSAGRFAGLLNCRQQKCDENRNNGNDDQQFDQRKSTTARAAYMQRGHINPRNDPTSRKKHMMQNKLVLDECIRQPGGRVPLNSAGLRTDQTRSTTQSVHTVHSGLENQTGECQTELS